MPITFNFTGTINAEVLSGGVLQKSYATIPKWIGKHVSGSVTLDLDSVIPEWSHEEQTYYSSDQDFGEWMTVKINNPHGTSYSIGQPIDPLAPVDYSSVSTYLTYNKRTMIKLNFSRVKIIAILKLLPVMNFTCGYLHNMKMLVSCLIPLISTR